MQSNISATTTLGTEENGRWVENAVFSGEVGVGCDTCFFLGGCDIFAFTKCLLQPVNALHNQNISLQWHPVNATAFRP